MEYKHKDIKLLSSRIITSEQILEDFYSSIFEKGETLLMKLKIFSQKKKLNLCFFIIILIQIFFLILFYLKPKIDGRITFFSLETIVFICIIIIALTLRDMNQKLKDLRKKFKLYFYVGFILILIFSIIQISLYIYVQYFAPPIGGIGSIGEGMTSIKPPPYTNFILISSLLIIIGVALMKYVTLKSKGKLGFDI